MGSDVVILFGGSSSERLVSVASAQNVCAHLREARCWFWTKHGDVFEVERDTVLAHARPFEVEFVPSGSPSWPDLQSAIAEAAKQNLTMFLSLHGGSGEDGTVQRVLEANHVAFTGSGSRASADAFDKARAKSLAGAQGARLAEARSLSPMSLGETQKALSALLERNARWVLKPQADGSSHGLVHLKAPGEVEAAAQTLSAIQLPYLAEVYVEGRELTVGVVDDDGGPVALPVSEVRLIPGGAFDYQGKYLGRGTEEITPAQLSDIQTARAQALAILTHRAVGCFGYSRTDMILTDEGPVLLEINTLPGMTKASFIPQQLAAAGRDVATFLEHQLQLARRRRDSQGTH